MTGVQTCALPICREKPEEEEEDRNQGEDEEQLGSVDPRVPSGLAPRRRELRAEEAVGLELAILQREKAHE